MSGVSATPEAGADAPAYHVELRQFPHNVCRFNLGERELLANVVEPWAREQWIEMGERKWSPHQAKLTVIEGPLIPIEQLSMGRGWRVARREGREVTDRLLAGVAQRGHAPSAPTHSGLTAQNPRSGGQDLVADSLGLELLAVLGPEHAPLRLAWEMTAARYPDQVVSESLALAERAVASLLHAGLIVLMCEDPTGGPRPIAEEEVESVLRRIDSWTQGGSSGPDATDRVLMSRA
jgi:hypothetical protein